MKEKGKEAAVSLMRVCVCVCGCVRVGGWVWRCFSLGVCKGAFIKSTLLILKRMSSCEWKRAFHYWLVASEEENSRKKVFSCVTRKKSLGNSRNIFRKKNYLQEDFKKSFYYGSFSVFVGSNGGNNDCCFSAAIRICSVWFILTCSYINDELC